MAFIAYTRFLIAGLFKKQELTEIYASIALRSFGTRLLMIFEPIYLYIAFGNSLTKTLLYFAVIYLVYALSVPFGSRLLARIGIKHAIFASIPILIGYYAAIANISAGPWMPFLAIVLIVMDKVLFLPAYHTAFMQKSSPGARGHQVGTMEIITSLGAVAGPFVGGFITATLGFPALFVAASVVFAASALPLFFSPDRRISRPEEYEDAVTDLLDARRLPMTVGFFAVGAENVLQLYIWPVFLYGLAISFKTLGAISSIPLFISLFVIFSVGRLSDHVSRERLVRVGAVFNAFGWVLKTFVRDPFSAFFAQTIYKIAQTTFAVPFLAFLYDTAQSDGRGSTRYIIYREMAENAGQAAMLLLAAGWLQVASPEAYTLFPLGALFSFLFTLL